MIDELSFLSWLTSYSQLFAYNIYYNVYSKGIRVEEECLEDFYLNTFIKMLKNNLERHGFKIVSVRRETDEYGEPYTIIELEKYKIIIRETIMCGVRESFEFLVVRKTIH